METHAITSGVRPSYNALHPCHQVPLKGSLGPARRRCRRTETPHNRGFDGTHVNDGSVSIHLSSDNWKINQDMHTP